ncbi:MAG: hypothetical protein P8N18_05890 [Hellea sp.]|nr:hypothetical protein [Hellea sp.]
MKKILLISLLAFSSPSQAQNSEEVITQTCGLVSPSAWVTKKCIETEAFQNPPIETLTNYEQLRVACEMMFGMDSNTCHIISKSCTDGSTIYSSLEPMQCFSLTVQSM